MTSSFTALPLNRSTLVLIFANLIPIIGVLYFNWSLFSLVFIYWLENVVIGLYTAVKMLLHQEEKFGPRLFRVAFFSFHYGMFCFVHGQFVVSLFGDEQYEIQQAFTIMSDHGLYYALIALIASHGFSFLQNFIGNGEREKQSLSDLMFAPYKRIVVLHLFIIFGALVIQKFGVTELSLILLAVIKIAVDLFAHRKEHKKLAEEVEPT